MTRAEMFAIVRANIEKIVEGAAGQQITEDVNMRDLGADSLQIVEVVSRSMKELKVRVPRTELSTAKSLRDLLDLFEQAAARATTT